MRGLEDFLRVAAAHDVINRNEHFKSFLSAKDYSKASSMVGKFFNAVDQVRSTLGEYVD